MKKPNEYRATMIEQTEAPLVSLRDFTNILSSVSETTFRTGLMRRTGTAKK
jgi:hypothetical protein